MTFSLRFSKLGTERMKIKNRKLILASKSPRRREILNEASFSHTRLTSNSSESFDENLSIDQNLCIVTRAKAYGVLERLSPRKRKGILILSADTVVVVGQRVLGKPKNSVDAQRMLMLLSGRIHRVKTCFCILCPDQGREVLKIATTEVGFRKMTKSEIQKYVQSKEPFDKAGAYAIQGKAQQFVNLVKGDFLNVVGLPINAIRDELRKQRWYVGSKRKTSSSSRAHQKR